MIGILLPKRPRQQRFLMGLNKLEYPLDTNTVKLLPRL
jgi:hypothetical protein